MIEAERGTGRTTRMLEMAMEAAVSGKRVVVIAANYQGVLRLRRLLGEIPTEVAVRMWICTSDDVVSGGLRGTEWDGVFADHTITLPSEEVLRLRRG